MRVFPFILLFIFLFVWRYVDGGFGVDDWDRPERGDRGRCQFSCNEGLIWVKHSFVGFKYTSFGGFVM
jgi:hypothetical protein